MKMTVRDDRRGNDIHERCRTARPDVTLVKLVGPLRDRLCARQSSFFLEPMEYREPIWMFPCHAFEFGREDRRLAVTIGIEQGDSTIPRLHHPPQNRHDGGDAAARCSKQNIAPGSGTVKLPLGGST